MLSDAVWQNILDISLLAARSAGPRLYSRRDRAPLRIVIHIGSIAHRNPLPELTLAYSTAKGALRTYSKGLAKGVASKGVRVNMISPGFIETSGVQKSIKDFQQKSGVTEEVARQQIMDMIGGIPLGRTGKPEEMAELGPPSLPIAARLRAAPTISSTEAADRLRLPGCTAVGRRFVSAG